MDKTILKRHGEGSEMLVFRGRKTVQKVKNYGGGQILRIRAPYYFLVRNGPLGCEHSDCRSFCGEASDSEKWTGYPLSFSSKKCTYLQRLIVGGGEKQGRFVIFRFHLFYSNWGSQDARTLEKTARKCLCHTPLCAPNASKN